MKQSGNFFLGRTVHSKESFLLESKDLCTHAVCMGMTGSGKTGLGIGLLEEAALDGIPAIIIDPKGDLGDLLLAFPELRPSDFLPWIDSAEAARQGVSQEAFAKEVASDWESGLKSWSLGKKNIQDYKDSVERAIYTPANSNGTPLSILNSFDGPSKELIEDDAFFRDRILSTVSSLLGLIGIDANPIQSKEHILISTILENKWKNGESINLESLIRQIQNPPFTQVGAFALDTFYPPKERLKLSMSLNNLLASPGFQGWMSGEPLDIQRLLYTEKGAPRHSIIYIAHLNDSERMFFVTLLLNELLSWVRKQSGTSSLRALFYMDEIFGFFPAIKNPPSKLPMISLLKQARAFGLGVVLSTQNPIDLDYRGLGNTGTWFIGKLQTERDRIRILEGLTSSSNGNMNTETLNRLLSECKKRNFLVQSIHRDEPVLMETRWTLSYLAGPLTLPQIKSLSGNREKPIIPEQVGKTNGKKPLFPAGIQEFALKTADSSTAFIPRLLGKGKLHFVDSANKIDVWEDRWAEGAMNEQEIEWKPLDGKTLTEKVPETGMFEEVPSSLFSLDSYKNYEKSFRQYLYQNDTYKLYRIELLKLTSKENESEEDFKKRAALEIGEKLSAVEEKIRSLYQGKIDILKDKIQRAQGKQAKEDEKTSKKRWGAWMSIIKTILAGLFSRKALSKGNISNVETSLRKFGSSTDSSTVSSADEIAFYQKQIDDFQDNQNQELNKAKNDWDSDNLAIETLNIRPKKTDLVVNTISILWTNK